MAYVRYRYPLELVTCAGSPCCSAHTSAAAIDEGVR
jgi:hypothetical protein